MRLLLILIFIIAFLPIFYIGFGEQWSEFWNGTISNFLAGEVALIVGIPIAFFIERKIKSSEDAKKNKNDRRRESEILRLIREELDFSLNSLFLPVQAKNSLRLQPLKYDLWDTVCLNKELNVIESTELLNRIVSAYYILKVMAGIERLTYRATRSATVVFEIDGKEIKAVDLLLSDARSLDKVFINNISEAIKVIDARMNVLEKYDR